MPSFAINILVLSRVGGARDLRRVLDWMIGFIDALLTPLGTIINYSAISISTLYTLHTLVSPVFTSRVLATDS
jgi:hypothetical protein